MPSIQVIPIASDQKVLNYTVNDEILSSISFNPLIIVVNDKSLSDDFYLSTNSQGMIRFPDLKALQRLVKRLGLTLILLELPASRHCFRIMSQKQIKSCSCYPLRQSYHCCN
ncbi:hypothetical protein SDC49_25295 [Lactobacillus sp. R2/2]|nr:hypothetical protein [Lactobacillus sp. R2/2]